MSNIYTSLEELIGHTPLLKLSRIEEKENLQATLLAKIEAFNPAGSAKDRVAKALLDDAEERGVIQPGATIIEPTSGNTGIGLAAIGTLRGYRVIITMPETMSAERQKLIRAYGAEVVLTDGSKGIAGSMQKAEELAAQIENSFIPGQFDNPANAMAHYLSTGPEIWEDTDGKVDIFVAGIGTGGTISGTGRYIKEQNPAVQIIGVEPASSPVLTAHTAGSHKIQGIGAGFVPQVLDESVVDEVLAISDEEAYEQARRMVGAEGVLVGISAGAALAGAIAVAKRAENKGKTIVLLLPDTGERYLSTDLFA